MRRGTTPTRSLIIKGYDLTGCTVHVYFTQDENSIVKTDPDVTYADGASVVSCDLTQEETLSLDANKNVLVQVRWIDKTGKVEETVIVSERVGDVLNDEVMEYDG